MNPVSIRNHLWWLVPGELAGMPLPSVSELRRSQNAASVEAFDDDVKFLWTIGIRTIVAALDLPMHRKAFQDCGFHYLSLQIPDGYPPTSEQSDQMLAFYEKSPMPLAVHCEGGIGRTGTLLAVIMVHRGLSASAAVRAVKAVMPPALETREQVEFVSRYERLLMSRSPNRKS